MRLAREDRQVVSRAWLVVRQAEERGVLSFIAESLAGGKPLAKKETLLELAETVIDSEKFSGKADSGDHDSGQPAGLSG